MIILGVDPGSRRTGYGAIQTDGRRHRLVEMGTVVPPPRLELAGRLRCIHHEVSRAIARLRPDVLAVEDVFHAINARSALVLGHVRGVVLLCGAEAGLVVSAFPPATVKLQVTGFGQAEKHQVALMVARLLELAVDAPAGDATDALAVALCHAHLHGRSAGPLQGSGARGLGGAP
jgi:crossover junction endodeoxyribonuclease RuvC